MKVKIYLAILLSILPFCLAKGQSVGLVLSGGGAKGLSHIGVIKALEEYNIPVDYICGTSMGAIIGGLYAAGFTPDEMLEMVKSKEFEAWYKGVQEKDYASYFYRDEPDASMFTFALTRKKEKNPMWKNPFDMAEKPALKIDFPTSIVSPYYMDMALIEVFAPASVVAGDDFNNLMVPFFCIAADVKRKEPLVIREGNLGSAIRASMSYPFVFKPVIIDSTLLFDGGFYNNFPWDIMEKDFNPDFIVGAKCVTGDMTIDEDDITTYVSNMLMSDTDYAIPQEKGVVIERKYPYGLMDFHKADEIAELGYKNALLYIEKIKGRINRERTPEEIDSMRIAFRSRQKELLFRPEVVITGNVGSAGKRFIMNTIVSKKNEVKSYRDIKRGYYRVVASHRFKTLYPSYEIDNDSLLTLKIRATQASAWSVSIGGNISSSSLNQGFLGASYRHLSERPWRVAGGLNMGKYYKGGYLMWRHDIGIEPLLYYKAELAIHQFDFYNGNQNLFEADRLPDNIQQLEYYGRIEFALPAAIERNIFLKLGLTVGQEYYRYYRTESNLSPYTADKTLLTLISPVAGLERNTLDYPLYPLSGRREYLYFRYNYNKMYSKYIFHAKTEAYFRISSRLSLGYMADLLFSNRCGLSNYVATMLYTPAFRPVPHNNTMIMEGYRANSYIGVGFSPVILFSNSLFLHCNISWFQPYESIVKSDNGKYRYSGPFPTGALLGNAAFVWQSPAGPVSLSATYYQRGENKWYTQLNIGFLIFKKRALDF